MTTADTIRELARQGLDKAEIARRLGIRYQQVYGVLGRSGATSSQGGRAVGGASQQPAPVGRPPLTASRLIEGGFDAVAEWLLIEGDLVPSAPLPRERGVYALMQEGRALYVGVATKSLARRLRFYSRPGPTQTTSIRIGAALKAELAAGRKVGIFAASPPDTTWNGLPVAGDVGLELGLIEAFELPWNRRGT